MTVIMVSYNTRELTLRALETLLATTRDMAIEVILWDNASHDGSADAVAVNFPNVTLVRSEKNLGFAAANNAAARQANGEWLLLLNPDTETHDRAIQNLLSFGKAHPQAGIVGGRTLFADGSLNIASCWNRMTVWSLFCRATGLSRIFARSETFNPEAIGDWKRDSVREVDIVVGCFFLIPKVLWDQLGGFREKYFMFGEEIDMCLRAGELGYRPMITPDAEIVHLVGASYNASDERIIKVLKGRVTLIRDHWSMPARILGIALIKSWVAGQMLRNTVALPRRDTAQEKSFDRRWKLVWSRRSEWLAGY